MVCVATNKEKIPPFVPNASSSYDYMGRRVEKKVYDKTGSVWTLSKHICFVYNGYKCIEELNGADSNALQKEYLWKNSRLLGSVYKFV